MTQEILENFSPEKHHENIAKNEVISLLQKSKLRESNLERNVKNLKLRVNKLEAIITELRQGNFDLNESLMLARAEMFAAESEKSSEEEIANNECETVDILSNYGGNSGGAHGGANEEKRKRILKPSQRYKNAEIREIHIFPAADTKCPCCNEEMGDSGLTEESERLDVIPKKYVVEITIKHILGCKKCHGSLITPTSPPAITPGGAFTDALTIDAAMSKYCDLMPMQRYTAMAERLGIKDLPPHSLIECSHQLAQTVFGAYRLLKQEILNSKVLHADETPHKMLEGDETENWYLWGFTNAKAAYFDAKDSRSGDCAAEILKKSVCQYLMSDVYSGYGRAVRITNEERESKGLSKIINIHCNAHSRRNFRKAENAYATEGKYFLDRYRSIYHIESQLHELRKKDPDLPPDKILEIRGKMRVFFEEMKQRASVEQYNYSTSSSIAKAMNYFLQNYDALTLFMDHPELPIDNNLQERILRNPVIGRKTWYGTHSKQGAQTAAVIFSLVESCKLNKVNPRTYFTKLVAALHSGYPPFTPATYAANPDMLQ